MRRARGVGGIVIALLSGPRMWHSGTMTLNAHQQRVLGALIEKEITTPEGYPLSLNALVNACNQRSSREPVLELSEDEVREALHGLEAHGLTTSVRDSRVPKYEHRARTVLNLRRDETAVICLLLLRGPQTPGELRSRSERLFAFDDLAAVQATLDRLAARRPELNGKPQVFDGPMVTMLARQQGSREARYAHLLGDVSVVEVSLSGPVRDGAGLMERLERLEAEVVDLRRRLEAVEMGNSPQ